MKLLVFCIDALCASDIQLMRGMPHFSRILESGSYVERLEPVFPALTYSCHTSILTGNYVARHGICHNEILKRGCGLGSPWHGLRKDIGCKTLTDYASERGMTACSLGWPVSGGADLHMNLPMIVPYHYSGWEPENWLYGSATDNLMQRYFHKHGRHIKGPDRSLDLLVMGLALDILEDYPQPDIMLVKMCDLDSARHTYGVYHEKAAEQLRKHDEEFGAIVETLRRKGTLDETNLVVIGDHGQTDVSDVLLINELLRLEGFITETDSDGNPVEYDAICHSTGLAAYVEMRNPEDHECARRLRGLLESLKNDPEIALGTVMDAEEAYAAYKVRGPFDFIVESALPIAFGETIGSGNIWGSKSPGDHKVGAATHGGSPKREEVTSFIACGPSIKPNVHVERRSMVDAAPTMASMLGLEMRDVDGAPVTQLLR